MPSGVPLAESDLGPQAKTRLAGLDKLSKLYDAFRQAADDLQTALGVPLCIDGCGLCCVTNTPSAYGIEVTNAVIWLGSQPQRERDVILDRIEAWLLRPVLEVEPPMVPSFTLHPVVWGKPKVGERGHGIPPGEFLSTMRGRCPLLGPDLRCSVYEVRPLGCRSYGVTLMSDSFCKRPRSVAAGETDELRAVHEGEATYHLRAHLRAVIEICKSEPSLTNTMFFPTALYAAFRPARMQEILPDVARVKLGMGQDQFRPHFFDEPLPAVVDVLPDWTSKVRVS